MTTRRETQVVLLTPEGRGAVASLLVDGPRSLEVVSHLFHSSSGRNLVEQPCGKALFGRWQSPTAGEELVICRRDSERIEIHCHGGRAAATAITTSLTQQGCRLASWRAWLRESAGDAIRADAQIALASATTERTAGILWDQYSGALSRALEAIAADIARGHSPAALSGLDALLDRADLGHHLVEPWQVVLAGRPNVGKSSLINALLGYQRAIVHETPGTTRDIVTAAAAIDGWPMELADTAGLHASSDPLEDCGIQLAQRRAATADLIVLVFDSSEAWSADDAALVALWPQALRVFNKCDLPAPDAAIAGPPETLAVSAVTQEGIADLERQIAIRLVPRAPAAGDAVPFTQSQVAWLRQVRAALIAHSLADAGEVWSRGHFEVRPDPC